MSVYLVVDLEIRDAEMYAEYIERVPATVAAHGGRYLVRGGGVTALAGGWDPERLVIIEFPTRHQYDAWTASPEYKEAAKLRVESATTRSILVEGL